MLQDLVSWGEPEACINASKVACIGLGSGVSAWCNEWCKRFTMQHSRRQGLETCEPRPRRRQAAPLHSRKHGSI